MRTLVACLGRPRTQVHTRCDVAHLWTQGVPETTYCTYYAFTSTFATTSGLFHELPCRAPASLLLTVHRRSKTLKTAERSFVDHEGFIVEGERIRIRISVYRLPLCTRCVQKQIALLARAAPWRWRLRVLDLYYVIKLRMHFLGSPRKPGCRLRTRAGYDTSHNF